jgi:hypothetical protein
MGTPAPPSKWRKGGITGMAGIVGNKGPCGWAGTTGVDELVSSSLVWVVG